MSISKQAIGVFDSGVGGLTVAKAINKLLPEEKIIYFGDSIHLPYGDKSIKTIIRYSLDNCNFLLHKKVKLIVVACNTSTAVALNHLQKFFSIPIIGVVKPGAELAAQKSQNKYIGVVGTFRTVQSLAYTKAIKEFNPKIKVVEHSCPLFVPMIESDFKNKDIIQAIIKSYLKNMENKIDTLILGCTHYPLIERHIKGAFPKWCLINSAQAIALKVKELLNEKQIHQKKNRADILKNQTNIRIYTNDMNETFVKLASKIFPQVKVNHQSPSKI